MTKPLNEEEIKKDKHERATKCQEEIEKVLSKYEFDLTATDLIGEFTQIGIKVRFRDLKNYDGELAQESGAVVTPEGLEEMLQGKGDKI